jgi:hypothetical protein
LAGRGLIVVGRFCLGGWDAAEAVHEALTDGLGIAAGDLRVRALPDAVIGYRRAG